MSLLWSGHNTKLSTNQKKPSPTYQDIYPGSARKREIHRGDACSNRTIKCRSIEGSSLFASLRRKAEAGMTVEAAVVMPLFLLFFLNLGSAMEMMRFHGNLQLALWKVGGELALWEYALESEELGERQLQSDDSSWWKELVGVAITSSYVKNRLVGEMGEAYVENSPVVGGVSGMSLWESDIVKDNGEMEIIVTYGVEPTWDLVEFGSFRMANHYYTHGWSGYEIPLDVQMVYVAEDGEVYHLNRYCTYLKLSIQEISQNMLREMRNDYGARYTPCEKCAFGSMPGKLYIAQKGDCYHFLRSCPGLKRTVRAIPLEETQGYRLCSRCGGENENVD